MASPRIYLYVHTYVRALPKFAADCLITKSIASDNRGKQKNISKINQRSENRFNIRYLPVTLLVSRKYPRKIFFFTRPHITF